MVATVERSARQRWSTADVGPRHALEYWIDTVCRAFLEIDIESPEGDNFHAQLEQSELGPANLYIVEAATQTVRRTPQRIAHSRQACYLLMQLRQGEAYFRQYGRECRVRPGDCVLVDGKHPYKLDCLPTTRSVMVRFPQEWLANWIPAPENLAARPFLPTAGWSAALSIALANLETEDEQLALPPGVVAEQIAALLALAAGPAAQASNASEKLLARLKRTVRDRCHESDLSPAAVAKEHGISKRYLHHLFANAGTTFGNELMRARLEAAHRLLSDGRYSALSINEVAGRCGFVESSHFARRFRKTYGLAPTEFRMRYAPGRAQRR